MNIHHGMATSIRKSSGKGSKTKKKKDWIEYTTQVLDKWDLRLESTSDPHSADPSLISIFPQEVTMSSLSSATYSRLWGAKRCQKEDNYETPNKAVPKHIPQSPLWSHIPQWVLAWTSAHLVSLLSTSHLCQRLTLPISLGRTSLWRPTVNSRGDERTLCEQSRHPDAQPL